MDTFQVFRWVLVAAMLGLGGCIAQGATPGGDENKSFNSLEHHGTIAFNQPAGGTIGESARVHSWMFVATGEAYVDFIPVSVDDGLDLFITLEWYGDGVVAEGAELRDVALEPGKYTVFVQSLSEQNGDFQINPTCIGDGCPAAPEPTAFTSSCRDRIYDALAGELISTTAEYESADQTGDAQARAAFTHYANLLDLPEQRPEEDFLSLFGIRKELTTGSVISISNGNDGDRADYAFDVSGELLYYYSYREGGTAEYFCGAQDEESMDPPEAGCLQAWTERASHQHDLGTARAFFNAVGDEFAEGEIAVALSAYAEYYELPGSTEVVAEVTRIHGEGDGYTNIIALSSELSPKTTYQFINTDENVSWMVFQFGEEDEGPRMVCEQSAN